MRLKDLIGLAVTKAEIDWYRTVIKLTMHTGQEVYLHAIGDCCSSSWYEDVEFYLRDGFFDKAITGVEELKMPEVQDPKKDSVAAYGYRIQTAESWMEIEMRNASNGYYGGEIHVSTEPPGEEDEPIDWRELPMVLHV